MGDEKEDVIRNRNMISNAFGDRGIVSLKQVHGTTSILCDENDLDSEDHSDPPLSGDALMTHTNTILVMIQVADCQPVMVYDPKQHVIANIHSGWRGSVQNIIGHTVHAMKENFGCKSDDFIAGVGPSLGPCCAEFVNYKEEIPEVYWKYKIKDNHFDLWSMSKDQLLDQGIKDENIELSNICTRCHTDEFFSYRGEGTTGRFGAVIGLR